MADIELVIKISEETVNEIRDNAMFAKDIASNIKWDVTGAIVNGIPLPKGHGDLIDRSKIHKAIPAEEDSITGLGVTYEEMGAYNDGIDAMYNLVRGAKPIIEADSIESEK